MYLTFCSLVVESHASLLTVRWEEHEVRARGRRYSKGGIARAAARVAARRRRRRRRRASRAAVASEV
jgi:hypothetical protein